MSSAVPTVRLSKYHGLGNDFLVMVVPDAIALDDQAHAELARLACDRHRGIGADGLLVCAPSHIGEADLVMRLCNADGSVAEMSGNGIRCFVHAAIDSGLVGFGSVRVATGGGVRSLVSHPSEVAGTVMVEVDMGPVSLNTIPIPDSVRVLLDGRRAATVNVGNPHIVIEAVPSGVDLPSFGPQVEEWYLGTELRGINVEVVHPSSSDTAVLDMAVWERGVGITEACGTGAVATAAAARSWNMVSAQTIVRQPGGDAEVRFDGDDATLVGPSAFVCVADLAVPASLADALPGPVVTRG